MVHSVVLRVGVEKRLLLHDAFCHFFLFSDHCAILEEGYLKSGKIAYPELVRSRTFQINNLCIIELITNIQLRFYTRFCVCIIQYQMCSQTIQIPTEIWGSQWQWRCLLWSSELSLWQHYMGHNPEDSNWHFKFQFSHNDCAIFT
jgi:hypothetical protein